MKTERFNVQQTVASEILDKIPVAYSEISQRLAREVCDGIASRLIEGKPLVVKMLDQHEHRETDYTVTFTRSVLFAEFIQCEKCAATSGGAVDPINGLLWCRTWGEFVDPSEFCARAEKRQLICHADND